jgi:predicted phage terminase large subunit-like protein
MVFMPPGSAKSTYGSILFPAWYLGHFPGRSVLAASHTTELAERFGRRVRNLVSDVSFQGLFDTSLAGDSQAAGRWSTSAGGEYYAAGVGSAILGYRADLGIIDDPVAGREAADSETDREKIWEWFKSDFYTRLKPGAAIVLIMQRWHEDDLAGRLLADSERGGDKWEVLRLPMEAEQDDALGREPGELLWPEWFTEDMRTQAKRDLRNWTALYQQQPVPDTGDFFRREWFHRYEKLPKGLRFYGCSDYAVTDRGGDYTEHGVFGIDPEENIYVVDWWSGQTAADVWIDAQLDLIARHKPLLWVGEAGPIRRAIEPFLTKRSRERKVYCRFEWLASITDKPTRARAFQARASMGNVYLPVGTQGDELLSQLLRFPAGAVDDKVDVCSLIGRALDQTKGGIVPKTKDEPKRDSWGPAYVEREQSWKTV